MNKFVKSLKDPFLFLLLFSPLLIYLGPRSYIAQDEGYYALQARWILDTGNWLAPHWWENALFDRAIGVQWLIAICQLTFGRTIWSAHLPSIISAYLTLYFTYKIGKEILPKKYSLIAPIILSTSFLWIDNAHLSSQDMPLLALEVFSIYLLILLDNNDIQNTKKKYIELILGILILPLGVKALP